MIICILWIDMMNITSTVCIYATKISQLTNQTSKYKISCLEKLKFLLQLNFLYSFIFTDTALSKAAYFSEIFESWLMEFLLQGIGLGSILIFGGKTIMRFKPYFFQPKISLLREKYNQKGDSFVLITGASDGIGK